MRGRICDAATVRLSRAGYHRMTIQDVVKKAAISTGALQHHFPTKEALVIAVAERLLSRSVRWFHRAKAELGSGAFPEMIRRSWREQFRTDDYGALLEILVAARTDKSLRTSVAPALERWRDEIEGELKEMLPDEKDAAYLETVLTISRCMMTGLLVHDGLLQDERRMDTVIDEWIRIVSRRD
ncbi:MAG: TetR/AcrR family transcriptional regulator [Amphiplicatus sp.]|nr:TetR/AcrR family transcriptional regulator [Amphiplicatus sp.]MCB9954807.1 TetR/AcrR family transcriptional regulator [Caulobacterales bacterium]HRX39334.1 helix-turn-helix domain-containing protein [Parvularculaceae bacterium]